MNNVAIYLRKSREELEETREETLARHENILLDFCKRNDLTITKIYREVVSGESIEKRPQMQMLLDDIAAKLYDGVVVVEIERLSRGNQIDQAEILEVFKKSNTKIYTLNKTYDLSSDDEFDEEFFEFGLFMSRREYKIIKRRLMRGKQQAFKEGYFTAGTCPYGFSKKRIDKGFVLVADDFESKIVQSIFYKFVVENKGISHICKWLNENGIKPRKAIDWQMKRVKMILRNKTYIGFLGYDYRGGMAHKYLKGKHDPIIDEDIFYKAQTKLDSQMNRKKTETKLVNPLATFTKCGICGRAMRSTFDVKRKKYTLKCLSHNCPTVMSSLEDVEKQLIFEIEKELKDFNYFLENHKEETEKKKQILKNEIQVLKTEIIKKETMINKCCEMLEEGIYTKEKYIKRVNILEEDLKGLKSNLEALRNAPIDDTDRCEKAIPILSKVLQEYWSLDPQEKNQLLKTIIEKVEYFKTKRNTRHNANDILFSLKIFLKI